MICNLSELLLKQVVFSLFKSPFEEVKLFAIYLNQLLNKMISNLFNLLFQEVICNL